MKNAISFRADAAVPSRTAWRGDGRGHPFTMWSWLYCHHTGTGYGCGTAFANDTLYTGNGALGYYPMVFSVAYAVPSEGVDPTFAQATSAPPSDPVGG